MGKSIFNTKWQKWILKILWTRSDWANAKREPINEVNFPKHLISQEFDVGLKKKITFKWLKNFYWRRIIFSECYICYPWEKGSTKDYFKAITYDCMFMVHRHKTLILNNNKTFHTRLDFTYKMCSSSKV